MAQGDDRVPHGLGLSPLLLQGGDQPGGTGRRVGQQVAQRLGLGEQFAEAVAVLGRRCGRRAGARCRGAGAWESSFVRWEYRQPAGGRLPPRPGAARPCRAGRRRSHRAASRRYVLSASRDTRGTSGRRTWIAAKPSCARPQQVAAVRGTRTGGPDDSERASTTSVTGPPCPALARTTGGVPRSRVTGAWSSSRPAASAAWRSGRRRPRGSRCSRDAPRSRRDGVLDDREAALGVQSQPEGPVADAEDEVVPGAGQPRGIGDGDAGQVEPGQAGHQHFVVARGAGSRPGSASAGRPWRPPARPCPAAGCNRSRTAWTPWPRRGTPRPAPPETAPAPPTAGRHAEGVAGASRDQRCRTPPPWGRGHRSRWRDPGPRRPLPGSPAHRSCPRPGPGPWRGTPSRRRSRPPDRRGGRRALWYGERRRRGRTPAGSGFGRRTGPGRAGGVGRASGRDRQRRSTARNGPGQRPRDGDQGTPPFRSQSCRVWGEGAGGRGSGQSTVQPAADTSSQVSNTSLGRAERFLLRLGQEEQMLQRKTVQEKPVRPEV